MTTTLREQAQQAAHCEIPDAHTKSHQLNYNTLYVYRDGSVRWHESISSDERVIDDTHSDSCDSIRSVPYLLQVGTGSCACNCDECVGPNHWDDPSDIEMSPDYYYTTEDAIDEGLNEIAYGYFGDEI